MTIKSTGRRAFAGIVAAVVIGITLPAGAVVLSPPTGTIEGHAPTVTGTLGILNPEGAALSTSSVYEVNHLRKPIDFLPDLTWLTTSDVDGDHDGAGGPPSKAYQAFSSQAWTWRRLSDNYVLPLSQQSLAFNQVAGNVDGTLYLVTAQVPVDINTVTGDPRGQTLVMTTPQYTVRVRDQFEPSIHVNSHDFTWAEATAGGFPQTVFTGAKFQFYMGRSGNVPNSLPNANYTYTTDQPGWTSVSPLGVVSITRMPTAAEKSVTITITDNLGVYPTKKYSFTATTWFVNGGSTYKTDAEVDTYCAGLGDGYGTPSYLNITNSEGGSSVFRVANGRLSNEWGMMFLFGSGWMNGYYWALESTADARYTVNFNDGTMVLDDLGNNNHVACSRAL